MANLCRMRWRWRAGCAGRGLWPDACAVKVENWHESQVFTRALPAAGPASTISKQWQAGHENAQVPQPMHVSACSFQKGSSKCVVTNARTACASNFFSGPAIALPVRSDFCVLPSNSARPLSVMHRSSYWPFPNSNKMASEPRSEPGSSRTDVQKQVSSCARQGSVPAIVKLVMEVPVEHVIQNRQRAAVPRPRGDDHLRGHWRVALYRRNAV